jgi:DNA-binding NtrC family response regulator
MTAQDNRRPPEGGGGSNAGGSGELPEPTVAIFSKDPGVLELAAGVLPAGWKLESSGGIDRWRQVFAHANIQVVVVDDEAIEAPARGWLFDRIRHFVPQAFVIYIASVHTPEAEKRARSYAAHYYTAKPLDIDRLYRVVENYIRSLSSGVRL